MKLFKRGKYYYIRLNENRKKSLKTGDLKTAQKLFREIKKREINKKLLILDTKNRISISEFISLYINDPDRKNLSEQTHRGDKNAFSALLDVLGDIPIKLVGNKEIKQFKQVCSGRMRPVSVNTYLRHIKAGLSWAKKEEYLSKVPAIQMMKTAQTPPRAISSEDVKKILSCAKKNNPEMYRIINFALFTGCRRAEIVRARYEHIKNGTIKIYGKGQKERIIPLLPQALNVTQDLGKIFSYHHASTLSNYFRKIVRECGASARFHDLRHTAATTMLAAGVRLEMVQKILGHADIRTTQIYADVLAETLKSEIKVMDGFSYE